MDTSTVENSSGLRCSVRMGLKKKSIGDDGRSFVTLTDSSEGEEMPRPASIVSEPAAVRTLLSQSAPINVRIPVDRRNTRYAAIIDADDDDLVDVSAGAEKGGSQTFLTRTHTHTHTHTHSLSLFLSFFFSLCHPNVQDKGQPLPTSEQLRRLRQRLKAQYVQNSPDSDD